MFSLLAQRCSFLEKFAFYLLNSRGFFLLFVFIFHMCPAGSAVGQPWGPCTAAQGASLTPGAGLGAAYAPLGALSSVLSGCRVPCHVVSAGASSRVSQEGTPLHPLSLGCELSSSIRAERWAGRVLGGPLFAWQPLLRQRLG